MGHATSDLEWYRMVFESLPQRIEAKDNLFASENEIQIW
jgi:hypothetical protein